MLPFALNQVAVARGMMEKDKLVTDFLYYNNVSLFDCTINWYTIVVSLSVLNHTYHGNHGCGQITQDWNLTDPFNTTLLAYRVPIVVVRLKLGVQLLFELSYYELDYIPITYLCEEKKQRLKDATTGKTRLIPDSWHVHVFFVGGWLPPPTLQSHQIALVHFAASLPTVCFKFFFYL